VIWALLAFYFFGGGGAGASVLTQEAVKEMGERVESVVEDTVRAEAAEQSLDELRAEINAFNKTFYRSGKDLEKIYKDHEAGAEQMLTILNDLNVEWDAAQTRAIELRFALTATLNQEEWSALVNEK
jgi:hypothetical protein